MLIHRYDVMLKSFNVRNNRAVANSFIYNKDREMSANMLILNSQQEVRGKHINSEPSKPVYRIVGKFGELTLLEPLTKEILAN